MGLIGLVLNESSSLGFGVKVQNHQLRLLCAVARPNSTHLKQTKVSQNPKNDGWEESHQLCWRGSNPPDDASWPSGLKCHKVADEITCRSQVHIITFKLSFWCIILIIIIGHFSPVLTSQSLTVPSSLLVTTNFELNWRQVTADWCLLGPDNNHHKSMITIIFKNKKMKRRQKKGKGVPDSVWRHWPVRISQILTVESALPDTKMLSRNSIPEVKLWTF